MKDLFVPLFKKYFLKIKNGEQNCEIRPANHRSWNSKNVYAGRVLLLSNGYGKKNRIRKEIIVTVEGCAKFAFSGIPQRHIDAVEAIYGKRDRWLVAYFLTSL